jgi:phosphatidylserine/phosphatidylglycerophosphate/cardiolipin synthase-like enzyme
MKKKQQTTAVGILALLIIALSLIFGPELIEELRLPELLDQLEDRQTQLPSRPADGLSGDWYNIYFTDPTCPPEDQRRGGVDEIIAADIRQATLQVDLAGYDINSEPIVQALIDVRQRDITVRVVTDSDNADQPGIRRLHRNGISVVEDNRSGLMHNKFIVIDGRFVWMGSMNFTGNGAHCNNNNTVRFDVPHLAVNYTAEMNEMYVDHSFGPTSPINTPHEDFVYDDVRIENYFGPEIQLAPIIAERVAAAQSHIHFMAFAFTHEEIGEAMMDRAYDDVEVRGVFELVGSNTDFSYFPVMSQSRLNNIHVRQDGNPRMMHHKVIIVDRQTVIFGSFNFSENANRRNDENIVIVHDAEFAGYFLEEFEAVWNEAREAR